MIEITGIWSTRRVEIDGKELRPGRSQKVWNHSPDGFNWGYGGSGPAQLALGILLSQVDEETALSYHQAFKWDVIARLPQDDFRLEISIYDWLVNQVKFQEERYSAFNLTLDYDGFIVKVEGLEDQNAG